MFFSTVQSVGPDICYARVRCSCELDYLMREFRGNLDMHCVYEVCILGYDTYADIS